MDCEKDTCVQYKSRNMKAESHLVPLHLGTHAQTDCFATLPGSANDHGIPTCIDAGITNTFQWDFPSGPVIKSLLSNRGHRFHP